MISLSVGVWLCGCVGVWVCGCVGACVRACMANGHLQVHVPVGLPKNSEIYLN